MRGLRRRVPRRPDIADDVASPNSRALSQPLRIAVEVRVVVAVSLRRVELVDGQASALAREQFDDPAILDGVDRRSAGRRDVERLVPTHRIAFFDEAVLEVLR